MLEMSIDAVFMIGLFIGIILGGIVTAFIICSLSNNRNVELNQRINKALEFIDFTWNNTKMPVNTIVALRTLDNILEGELDYERFKNIYK